MLTHPFRFMLATLACVGLLCSSLMGISTASAQGEGLRLYDLRAEYRQNPMGIDVKRPRLSWKLQADQRAETQSAYRIIIASDPETLSQGVGDVWDSGRVSSNRSVHVTYDGPPLESRERYYWTVRIWDDEGDASPWAEPAWWEMGLLENSDWRADWIYRDSDQATPVNNTEQNQPVQLDSNQTLGQTFVVDGKFVSVAGRFPAWGSSTSDVTLTLRREGPHGEVVATRRLTDHPDNGWGAIELEESQPAGTYYVEMSDANGDIGWWSHTDDTLAGGSAYVDGAAVDGDRTLRVGIEPVPEPLLRREFSVGTQITRARLYATALGVYELRLNGERVGKAHLAPGWTDYRKRVQYQTYDVTDLLQQGENALGAMLGKGWYAGHIAIFGPNQYGSTPHLRAQLEITYADGTSKTVVTDGSWQTSAGPITSADLLMGEAYDARREQPGWATADFDASSWESATAGVTGHRGEIGELVAQNGPTVQMTKEIQPIEMTEPEPGTYVFDMGQNMVGNVRLRVQGEAGTTVRIRHAEVLKDNGMLYTANLRSAKATDHYTLSGDGTEVYEPRFTFHGFRYVELTGYPGTPDLDTITGRVLRSAAPITANLETSDPMVNQLVENILWGQRGNFLSIPTDTPARDERMGWTGDINVFVGAAAYNMQVDPFLTKWLQDLRDGQLPNGAFPDVAPRVGFIGGGAFGWGDAGVTVPWTLWQRYGDTRVIEQQYEAMGRWIDYLVEHSDNYIRPASGYGDWLNVNDPTPKDLMGTAYFAHSTGLVAEMADAIGKTEDAKRYRALAADVEQAFRDAYVEADGSVKGDSQTGYVMALAFDLLPQQLRDEATAHLVGLIEQRGWHLSTGFLGTPDLLPVLSNNDELDVAYRLLLQDTYPSWGYQIARGATTMWEHWDSIKPDGSFENPAMNSFNHYAYGAVGEWMYRNLGGINPDPNGPGFQHTLIRPRPGGGIDHATASYQSVYGEIGTSWREQGHRFTLDLTVPGNTTTTVHVPAVNPHAVTESGTSAGAAEGVRFLRMEDGAAVYAVGSGTYHFESDDVRGHLQAAAGHASGFRAQAADLVAQDAVTGPAGEELLEKAGELVGVTGRARDHYVSDRQRPATEAAAGGLARTARLEARLDEYVDDGAVSRYDADTLVERLDEVEAELSAASVDLHGVTAALSLQSTAAKPGSTTMVTAVIENAGSSVLHDPRVNLQLPEGWSATSAGETPDTIGGGETVRLPLEVSVPKSQALIEGLELAGELTYRRGQADINVPVAAIVDVVSPVEIVAMDAEPRILQEPGDTSLVSVTIRNVTESAIEGAVEMTAPAGWFIDSSEVPYRLEPGHEGTVTAKVTSPEDVPAPAGDIRAAITYGDLTGATGSVRVTSALASWTFETEGDAEGWEPANSLTDFVVSDGLLTTSSTGGDPFMVYGEPLSLDVSDGATVEIRLATSASSDAQLFWGTEEQPFFSEGKSTRFAVESGDLRTYSVRIPPQSSPLTALRIDPLTVQGDIRIESIRVVR